jgi:hypothetical protein
VLEHPSSSFSAGKESLPMIQFSGNRDKMRNIPCPGEQNYLEDRTTTTSPLSYLVRSVSAAISTRGKDLLTLCLLKCKLTDQSK